MISIKKIKELRKTIVEYRKEKKRTEGMLLLLGLDLKDPHVLVTNKILGLQDKSPIACIKTSKYNLAKI